MARFIVADWHLNEDRMEILGRPFVSGDDCVNAMIELHNAVVKPDDEVIVVGDVCYQKALHGLPLVAKLNGRETLVRGNHDRGLSDSDLAPYFEKVVAEGECLVIEHNGVQYNVVHYPTLGVPDMFNLVGHIHTAWKVQKNMLNVGVDVHHFRPVNLDKIPFFVNAICNFYDEDVWVSGHDANSAWNNRGKSGSYFDPKPNM